MHKEIISTIIEIHPDELLIEAGFNPREAFIGDKCYTLEPVKSTIVAIKLAYKEGRSVELIKVVKHNNKYFVRQGHCRTMALKQAMKEGADIKKFKVMLITGLCDGEEYLENIDGNQRNALNPVSQGFALQRALTLGYSVEELAQRYQRSITTIRNTLKIMEMPEPLLVLLSFNRIKKTLAIEIMLRYENDHNKVMEHLRSVFPDIDSLATAEVLTISETKHSNSVVSMPTKSNEKSITTPNDDLVAENQEAEPVKENDAKLTRKSLGIRVLSKKKTERLKSSFLKITNEIKQVEPCDETVVELQVDKKFVSHFEHVSKEHCSENGDGLCLKLSENQLRLLANLLSNEHVALFLTKEQVTEVTEIQQMLAS